MSGAVSDSAVEGRALVVLHPRLSRRRLHWKMTPQAVLRYHQLEVPVAMSERAQYACRAA